MYFLGLQAFKKKKIKILEKHQLEQSKGLPSETVTKQHRKAHTHIGAIVEQSPIQCLLYYQLGTLKGSWGSLLFK